jgi:hypothetical protein
MGALTRLCGFAEEFREPGQMVIPPERFAAALNLQRRELARLAGAHRSSVSEAPANA